jgi:hypothetical protein
MVLTFSSILPSHFDLFHCLTFFSNKNNAYRERKNFCFTINSQSRHFALYGMGQISLPPTPRSSCQNKFRSTATPARINAVLICEQWQHLLLTLQLSPTPISTHVMQHSHTAHNHFFPFNHSRCLFTQPKPMTLKYVILTMDYNFHHRAFCHKLIGLKQRWRCDLCL